MFITIYTLRRNWDFLLSQFLFVSYISPKKELKSWRGNGKNYSWKELRAKQRRLDDLRHSTVLLSAARCRYFLKNRVEEKWESCRRE
jgi:hypothetical protein